ncbi:hypothetical protein GGG16DRAFT_66948 [Schizophyllum commune]
MKTLSGLPRPASYRIRDGAFNLTDLHLNAQVSQRDEAALPSADVSDPSSLIEQVGRCLEAQSRRPLISTARPPPVSNAPSSSRSSSPSPSEKPSPGRARRRLGKRQPSPTASKSPARKKARRIPLPPFMQSSTKPQTPDLSQYSPAVGGASQAKKRRSRTNRAKKAARRDVWKAPNTSRPAYAKHLRDADCEQVDLDWEDMPATSTGFTAKREETETAIYTREELINEHGFDFLNWSGVTPTGILAPDGKVFAACIGGCDDPEYVAATESLGPIFASVNEYVTFPKDASDHRRGQFGAQANGPSHGGGQTEPGNLVHNAKFDAVLAYLIALPAMVRIAHFASDAFANWAPRLFAYYNDTMKKLFESDRTLRRNFPRSVWACVTINFGPRTVTYKHRDFGNLSFGWCAITALGDFNPDLGGDLVLWECKLIIRFPPGSTVLIPSAIINHSNTAIAEGETRYSVTQYTSGALFRWVEHGFQLDEKFYAGCTAEERAAARKANRERWEKGVEMFSTWDELQEHSKLFA